MEEYSLEMSAGQPVPNGEPFSFSLVHCFVDSVVDSLWEMSVKLEHQTLGM